VPLNGCNSNSLVHGARGEELKTSCNGLGERLQATAMPLQIEHLIYYCLFLIPLSAKGHIQVRERIVTLSKDSMIRSLVQKDSLLTSRTGSSSETTQMIRGFGSDISDTGGLPATVLLDFLSDGCGKTWARLPVCTDMGPGQDATIAPSVVMECWRMCRVGSTVLTSTLLQELATSE
jgi:hypothetical protein